MSTCVVQPAGKVHTLFPGDVVCAERGDTLQTLLGSCIAAVLTDPRRTLGVMSHIVHAGRPGKKESCAFADAAFDMMFTLLRERGIDPFQCVAYVYGGGNMFPSQNYDFDVGKRNAGWVLERLAYDGIKVVMSDVGGCAYRRLSWMVGPDAPQVIAGASSG